MKPQQKDLGTLDEDTLIYQYTKEAILHGEAIAQAATREANRGHRRITRIYNELRARGAEALRRLLPLLEHPDFSVRCWAAVHCLRFAPERSEQVLAEVAAKGPVPLCLTAETLLIDWRKGVLPLE